MNAPDRFELFVLPDDAKKISMTKDTKIPNACMFTILKEDHTLGNLIRMQLVGDPDVKFAGYRMPHPLEHNITIKIQTFPQSTPIQALEGSIHCLIDEFQKLEIGFINQMNKKKSTTDTYMKNYKMLRSSSTSSSYLLINSLKYTTNRSTTSSILTTLIGGQQQQQASLSLITRQYITTTDIRSSPSKSSSSSSSPTSTTTTTTSTTSKPPKQQHKSRGGEKKGERGRPKTKVSQDDLKSLLRGHQEKVKEKNKEKKKKDSTTKQQQQRSSSSSSSNNMKTPDNIGYHLDFQMTSRIGLNMKRDASNLKDQSHLSGNLGYDIKIPTDLVSRKIIKDREISEQLYQSLNNKKSHHQQQPLPQLQSHQQQQQQQQQPSQQSQPPPPPPPPPLSMDESSSIEVMESLYDLVPHNSIPHLGTVGFIGTQGSDKSSIIESLLGVRLYEKNNLNRNIAVSCIRTRGDVYFEVIEGGWRNSGKLYDIEQVRKKVAEINTSKSLSNRDLVSVIPIEIVYAAPHLHNIKLVDFVPHSLDTHQRDILSKVNSSVTNYLFQTDPIKRTIVFCTESFRGPLDSDYQSVHVVDHLYSNTIGVLTKMDKLLFDDSDTNSNILDEAASMIQNKKYHFNSGWVGFCSNSDHQQPPPPPQQDSSGEKETRFPLQYSTTDSFKFNLEKIEQYNKEIKESIEIQHSLKIEKVGPNSIWNKILYLYIFRNRNEINSLVQNSLKYLQMKSTVMTSMANVLSKWEKREKSAHFKLLTHPSSQESILIKIFDETLIEAFKLEEKDIHGHHLLPNVKRYSETKFTEKYKQLQDYLGHPVPIKKSDAIVSPINYNHYVTEWTRFLGSPELSQTSLADHLRHHLEDLKQHCKLYPDAIQPPAPKQHNTSSSSSSSTTTHQQLSKQQVEFENWNASYRKTVSKLLKQSFELKIPTIINSSIMQLTAHLQPIERFYLMKTGEAITKSLDTNIFKHQIYKEQTPSLSYEEFRSVLHYYYPLQPSTTHNPSPNPSSIMPTSSADLPKVILSPFSVEWTQVYLRGVSIKIANDIVKCALHNIIIPTILQTNQSIFLHEMEPIDSLKSSLSELEKEILPKEASALKIGSLCNLQISTSSLQSNINGALNLINDLEDKSRSN
ncbi:RNA polymerase II core subunit [Cavenderia fasciculata]|uniref:RNA polymerase II core subunit n=1 Tax=Cavenderia fasciculata TaxID=261658 RepID=F4Q1X1_CACFS|nr:RNA polymerase II core subunit [Cavenderia fasciculata]EGG17991.1 RNA polymerase II core subunit [Cavenderia fasciculata]|eukprot:XP_004356883.1 RNA polymerase II core subunit [Cavenderia fasciculata]